MKAMVVRSTATGTVLEQEDIPEPELGPGQVRIAVRAASVNRADLAQRAGTHGPAATPAAPVVVGLDAAGTVLDVGAGVTGPAVGDRVMTLAGGGLAERIVVDARTAIPVPGGWSLVEGAAAVLGLLTEHDALRTAGRLQPGESVLVHAAASGVGLQGVQLARYLRAGTVIASVRSGRARDLLLSLGAGHVLEVGSAHFADAVRELTGGAGVDVVVDHVGGPYLEENVRAAAVRGRLVGVGRLGGAVGTLDMEALAFKRLEIIGVTFRTRSPDEKAAVAEALRNDVDLEAAAGALRPTVDRVLPWTEVEQAQAVMAGNGHVGKMVLELPASG